MAQVQRRLGEQQDRDSLTDLQLHHRNIQVTTDPTYQQRHPETTCSTSLTKDYPVKAQPEVITTTKMNIHHYTHPSQSTLQQQPHVVTQDHIPHQQQHEQLEQTQNQPRKMEKVVGFTNNMPFPIAKKPRLSAETSAQNITIEIQHGVAKNERKEAMMNAGAAFDHGVQVAHDSEIRVGADIAIFKHLTFLLYKKATATRRPRNNQDNGDKSLKNLITSNSMSDISDSKTMKKDCNDLMDEIGVTLSTLEMVLRCSADCIEVSFMRIGEEILPIIVTLLNDQLERKQKRRETKNHLRFETQSNQINQHIANTMNESRKNSHDDMSYMRQSPTTTTSLPPSKNSSDDKLSTTSTTSTAETQLVSNEVFNTTSNTQTRTEDLILKTCTKILGHFARVGNLTSVLAEAFNLITTLLKIVSMSLQTESQSSSSLSIIPIEAKLNSLWVIANLACAPENMIRMAKHPGLVDVIVQVASYPKDCDESTFDSVVEYLKVVRSRSIAVRAILNLSWAHDNKVIFSQNDALIAAILHAATHRTSQWTGNGKGVSWVLLQGRGHAAGALRNLAAAPRRYKRRLCRFQHQVPEQDSSNTSENVNPCVSMGFLEIMADIATHDSDRFVRDKIHAAVFNLVSADTAKIIVEHKSLIDVIVKAATSTPVDDDIDVEKDTSSKSMALQTLRSLEKAIPEDEEDYEVLRPVLSRFDSNIVLNRSISSISSMLGSCPETAI